VRQDWASIEIRFPRHLELTSVPLIWKEVLIQHAVQHAGVSVSVHGFGQGFYGGGGSAVASFQLKVLGYNYNEVFNIAKQVARRLERNARVREVDFTSSGRYGRGNLFELIIQPHREKLSRFKLSVAELMHKVTLHLQENLHQQTLLFQGQELRYTIKLAGAREFNTEDLLKMVIESPAGEKFLLAEVAEISPRRVMSSIDRENQQYQRMISFEFRGPHKLGQRFVESVIQSTHLPPGYKLEESGYFSMSDKETQQIYLVLAVSLVLVFMVTAALFESLRQPFAVLLTVPLALIGVFLIFYLTDTNFDRNAYIGVILLGGIVVNNAILLIHHINKLREQGDDLIPAIINATEDRVRPILMTTLTTVLGLLPLVIFAEEQASMWYTLALATIGGLLSSAPLVLFVIPSFYFSFARRNASR
jgi:multidrug efflux pump subunit AcrB